MITSMQRLRPAAPRTGIIAVALLLAACGGPSEENAQPAQGETRPHEHEHEHADHDHGHGDAAHGHDADANADLLAGMSLNAGEPWQMDAHTRESLARMQQTIAEAPLDDHAERRALGTELSEQKDALIAGCTMSGAAHDQLHIYLGALLPAIDALRSAETAAASQQALERVRSVLSRYEDYFA